MFKIPKQEYTAEFKELAVQRVNSGQGLGAVALIDKHPEYQQAKILQQEMAAAGAVNPISGFGIMMWGPTLLDHGTDDVRSGAPAQAAQRGETRPGLDDGRHHRPAVRGLTRPPARTRRRRVRRPRSRP